MKYEIPELLTYLFLAGIAAGESVQDIDDTDPGDTESDDLPIV